MSTRLPLLGARPARDRTAPAAARPRERVSVSRPLLCLTSAGASPALMQFACRLIAELSASGCEVGVLCSRGAADASSALREAGAREIVEPSAQQLPQSALDALSVLPERAIAIGIGAELCDHLQPLLTIRIGSSEHGAEPHADLELPLGSVAVASAIGAWLVSRWHARARVPA